MTTAAIQRRIADLWMLRVVPQALLWLPWRIAYRGYRWLARGRSLYGEAAGAARVAADYVPIADLTAFLHDVRTTRLLDVIDLERSRRHALDWWPEDVEIAGTWPSAGAFVAVTFHYGTGLWLCRSLRRAGRRSVFLSARFERSAFSLRPQLYRYGMRRLAEVERLCGEPVASRPQVRTTLRAALARGVPVIGLIDVPPRLAARGQRPVRLLGREASLPDGLLVVAAEAGVPIVPCWVEIDFESGRRRVVIGAAQAPLPVDAGVAALAAHLDALLRTQPAAWMFWEEWPRWLDDSAAAATASFSKADAEGTLTRPTSSAGPTP